MPDQTIAPMAKRAPNESTLVAISTTSCLTHSLSAQVQSPTARPGLVDASEQPLRKLAAPLPVVGSHAAKLDDNTVKDKSDMRMRVNDRIIVL
jgi:hypothetical protein